MIKVKFDGYAFGERTLEGMSFIGEVDDKGKIKKVYVAPADDGDYWQEQNTKLWLKRAEEHLEHILEEGFQGDPDITVKQAIEEMIDVGELEAA